MTKGRWNVSEDRAEVITRGKRNITEGDEKKIVAKGRRRKCV